MATTTPETQPAHDQRALEKEWWLRTLLVLQAPRATFAALRDDSDDAAEARQEPMLAISILAGISVVLGTSAAARIFDDYEITGLLIAVWAFVAGAIYGVVTYFVVGAL